MRLASIHKSLTALSLALLLNAAHAGEWIGAGIRAGNSDVIELEEYPFTQLGVFGLYSLPWEWQLASGRPLKTTLNVELDYLDGPGNNAWVFSTGPELDYRINASWTLQAGASVAYVSDPGFPGNDLGSQLQFIAHVSARYDLSRHWAAGLRLQHASNAGLSTPNMGLDLMVLEILRRF